MSIPYTKTRWSLSDLFSTPETPALETAFGELDALVSAFEGRRSTLTDNIITSDFFAIIKELETITDLAYRLGAFASLRFTENTQDQDAQVFVTRVDQFMADLSNRTLFFGLWWKALDDVNAARLMSDAGDYSYWLQEMRHFKPHTLTEPEEKIINTKDVTGTAALNTLYDTLTNRYTFKIKVGRKKLELTRGELMVYARHHDPELRAAAYRELYQVYGKDAPILGQIYQALVRDWRNENVSLRHYASPISARNLANDIPDPVVDTLLDVCRANAPIFQRYFRLKARWLGLERLRRYDVYAPVAHSDKAYPYAEAVEMVLDSFGYFDPLLADLARRVFDKNHLDSEVRKGKRSGAFCSTVTPELTPWVLVNYQERPDDVATLAHELGHAIHSMLAAEHHLFTQHASLPLAETASTFGEMMLVDRLLARETDPGVRRDLLFRQVDDAYATIMRQAFFAMFERQVHEMVNQNASVDEMASVYLDNLRFQFNDAVEVSDEFRWEWISIPHFYQTPFYVYAYAFGQLLVFSLYQQYQLEGDAFKPRYLRILRAGGSLPPEQILKDAGIDFRRAEFWQGGFDAIAKLVTQLEALPFDH
jgi:oligoendopeptidase F